MRTKTDYLIIHCAATKSNMDVGVKEIREWHIKRGFNDIGYHYVIRRNGEVEKGRNELEVGAHVAGYNSISVGVSLVGGVGGDGKAENNFTPEQFKSLKTLILELKKRYPNAKIVGHRDLSPDKNHDGKITPDEWLKECPSFSVADWLAKVGIK